jgi:hypothetical protein
MHKNGCHSERTKAHIVLFDKQVEQLAANLSDTLLIVTADHGLIDVNDVLIQDYPEIGECLAVPLNREPRSLSLFVKPEYKDIFPERWERQFGQDFELMTAAAALEQGLFGSGIPHVRVNDFLGDYLALATGSISLWNRDEDGKANDFKAAHAGLRHEEMVVPLILHAR